MKSLSLTRPLIVMMVGLPGAGKSFFARQFADTFNAPLISTDYLRREIFPEPSFARDEDQLLERLALQQTSEIMKVRKTMIIDGGCNPKVNRQDFERVAKAKGYGTLIIWVQTDIPTCRTRATKRNPSREGDLLNASMSPEAFESAVKRLTPPSAQETTIVISGKHTYATQLRVILKKLAPAREETAAQPPEPSPQAPQQPPFGQRPYGDLPTKPHRVTIS